jgi:hypothetical protein
LPWDNGRWQTWVVRGLGILISLLAFPALEDMFGPNMQDYVPRVQWIGLVVLTALVVSILGWTLKRSRRSWL